MIRLKIVLSIIISAIVSPAIFCEINHYNLQIEQNIQQLKNGSEKKRSTAVENLGFMRAKTAEKQLIKTANDPSSSVRREVAMALGWCGGKKSLPTLIKLLSDQEWSVAQSAWCSLCNITGMNFPFDALADNSTKSYQVNRWQKWTKKNSSKKIPRDIKKLLKNSWNPNLAYKKKVTASNSTNEPGCEPKRVTDGDRERLSWLVKKNGYPQFFQIDLKKQYEVSCIALYQSQINRFLTEFSLAYSSNGNDFTEISHYSQKTAKEQFISFKPVKARFIRLTAYKNTSKEYLATIHEFEVYQFRPEPEKAIRALRALGTMQWQGADELVIETLEPFLKAGYVSEPQRKQLVQAGIRALGRLKSEESFQFLSQLIQREQWAHYVAEAFIDLQHPNCAEEIVNIFSDFSMGPNREVPKKIHPLDRPGLSPIDRMYCAPYSFALALSTLPWTDDVKEKIFKMTPLFVANMPGDYDTAMLYEPESWHHIFRDVFDRTGTRKEIIKIALKELGCNINIKSSFYSNAVAKLASRQKKFGNHNNEAPFCATWLPALCKSGEFTEELESLLTHKNGWVKINVAKALSFTNSKTSAATIYKLLKESKSEADYGLHGEFNFWNGKPSGTEEFNDPCPRWREAFIAAIATLEYKPAADLIITIMNDEKSALEIRYAAVKALDQLGTENAIKALETAATNHPYHSAKVAAREALWRRGIQWRSPNFPMAKPVKSLKKEVPFENDIIFIKGDKNTKNHFQMDNWRQLYATTDSGPTYRHGNNIYRLNQKTGKTVALTKFTDGFVADIELSWDGDEVIFARRGGDKDPWWHIFTIKTDGSDLKQLTFGNYHDVQPTYLPDGRIVFSSSRMGMRDEYHGYLATGLTVMNADGSNIDCISQNLGRDAEPVVLNDGRIGFSRLELFYSRLKTEWNLQAVYPDGTKNVTLYGPEFRQFWYNNTYATGVGGWVISGLRHRTLRVSQVRPFGSDRFLCITQKGLTIVGPGRLKHSFVPHSPEMVVTTPDVISNETVLCAAGKRDINSRSFRYPIDLGIYTADVKTGELKLIYNDPEMADFEPRLIRSRKKPSVRPETKSSDFEGTIMCADARLSQETRTAKRGCYVRIIEGRPAVTRHQSHTAGGLAWKNHTGTFARVLGTVPLAADGSFFLKVPADHLIHCQILDADRQVVGNQLIWMYSRPKELKSCVGCHETPDSTPKMRSFPKASTKKAIACFPYGGEFSYRAKYWNKGHLPDEGEERVRSVRAVNLIGRE